MIAAFTATKSSAQPFFFPIFLPRELRQFLVCIFLRFSHSGSFYYYYCLFFFSPQLGHEWIIISLEGLPMQMAGLGPTHPTRGDYLSPKPGEQRMLHARGPTDLG